MNPWPQVLQVKKIRAKAYAIIQGMARSLFRVRLRKEEIKKRKNTASEQ